MRAWMIALGAVLVLVVAVGGWIVATLREIAPADPVVHTVSDATRRTLAQGELVGFEGPHGEFGWQGIPFAAPPVGDLRWRAPKPPAPWMGTREALSPGPPCVQTSSPLQSLEGKSVGEIGGSEDCLTLNVFTPPLSPAEVPQGDAHLPVMVWIHGGSNTHGTGGTTDGGNLAVSGDVVVVTLNYRLGPFGWFSHAALRAGASSPEDASGNYGTLDLIAALGWIRDNVELFGGDPRRVTVFGESAGGSNIVSLLLSPLAEGLFQRAIVQSGGTYMMQVAEAENYADNTTSPGFEQSSKEIVLRLLERDGAKSPSDARQRADAMGAAELAAYLRGQNAEELLSAYLTPGSWRYRLIHRLQDGVVIPKGDVLARLMDPANYNAVPIIFGTNRDEAKLFMLSDEAVVENRFGFLPTLIDANRHAWAAEHRSTLWKWRGADAPATVLSQAQDEAVFVYRFDWDEERSIFGSDLSVLLGAAHGMEIAFVFGNFGARLLYDRDTEASRTELSRGMMSYWSEFAHTGDPSRGRDGTLPRWQPWESRGPNEHFLVFDTPADGGIRHSDERVTEATLIAGVASDPRMEARDKCAMYREFAFSSNVLTPETYPLAGNVGCDAYPLADFPWDTPAVASARREEAP